MHARRRAGAVGFEGLWAICEGGVLTSADLSCVSAAVAVTVFLACLSVVFSILACVVDTDKDIGGNW